MASPREMQIEVTSMALTASHNLVTEDSRGRSGSMSYSTSGLSQCEAPAWVLSKDTLSILCMDLNVPAPIRNSQRLCPDFRGLSALLGLFYELFEGINEETNPTQVILSHWVQCAGATVGQLVRCLGQLGRHDVIKDVESLIGADVARYMWYESRSLEFPAELCAASPAPHSKRYHAFVSHCEEDFPFVQELLKLEETEGFKLCIPERDLMTGIKYELTAETIEEDCHKTLLILSEDFLRSEECMFAIRYAMALPQDSGRQKIVPIIVRPCRRLPRIVNFMAIIDYTRKALRPWFWHRLARTIKDIPKENDTKSYKDDLKQISLSKSATPCSSMTAP